MLGFPTYGGAGIRDVYMDDMRKLRVTVDGSDNSIEAERWRRGKFRVSMQV